MRAARASQATARYRAHHHLDFPFLAAPKAEAPVAKPAPPAKTQPATEVPAAVVPRKPAAAVVEAAPVPAAEPKAEPKAAAAKAVAKTPAAPVVEEAIAPSAEGPARRAASPITRSRVAVAPAPEEEGPEASWVLDSAPEAEPTEGAHLWAGVALLRQTCMRVLLERSFPSAACKSFHHLACIQWSPSLPRRLPLPSRRLRCQKSECDSSYCRVLCPRVIAVVICLVLNGCHFCLLL